MTQLVFDLTADKAFGRADFFISKSNAAALSWVDRWPDWPSPVLVLHGEQGSGKTHLAHLWAARAAAKLVAGTALDEALLNALIDSGEGQIAIDDADRAPEILLLHCLNLSLEAGGTLLLTARRAPGVWRPMLPDLGSRLRAALAVGIGQPDDSLLSAVLAKHFADRQVRVGHEVIAVILTRMERSFAAAAEIASALDRAALSHGGAITLPLARRVLAERAGQPPPADRDPGIA